MKILKCSRVGKLEELDQVQYSDCHFIVLSSREHPAHPQAQLITSGPSLSPPWRLFQSIHTAPLFSCFSHWPVSWLNAGTIILFYLGGMLAYLGRCQ